MTNLKWVWLAAVTLLTGACATYDFESSYQHRVNLDSVARTAKQAVGDYFNVDLSAVTWELADQYRMRRLAYTSAYDEYRTMVNHTFYARVLATAASTGASPNILGRYKENLDKVYINPESVDEAYSYDLKDAQVARQIYLALFIHELVHAADHKRFSKQMNQQGYIPGKSELLNALMEGNAEYVTDKLCQNLGCAEGQDILQHGSTHKEKPADTKKTDTSDNRSKVYKQELRFRYVLGKKYIAGKYLQLQGEDPMPRNLEDLRDSPMLILYPDSADLLNGSFTKANQMMERLDALKTWFSNEQYIFHYDVFSPPRMRSVVKFLTGISFDFKQKSPPYLQTVSLKLYDISNENYFNFDQYAFLVTLLDFGESLKSERFIEETASAWDSRSNIDANLKSPQGSAHTLSYTSNGKSMIVQHDRFGLLINANGRMLDEELLLSYSEKILSGL
jgi:hypothetical protein